MTSSLPPVTTADVDIEARDFSPDAIPTSPNRVHYDEEANVGGAPARQSSIRSTRDIPNAPILRRRQTRVDTSKTTRTIDETSRTEWHPGQEPGLDPSKDNGGRAVTPTLHEECQITVVDFSEDDMEMHDFGNQGLIDFVQKPQEEWIKCRWISVNGLSWDVIQALGNYKKLHRLAIEDLMNTKNRTKADWYADHTYMVLTLQKLIHLHPDDEDSEEEIDDKDSFMGSVRPRQRRLWKSIKKTWGKYGPTSKFHEKRGDKLIAGVHDPRNGFVKGHTDGIPNAQVQKLKTLQRYHGGPNQERMAFMEAHSPLTRRKLAVASEQVSIFLTTDNTVICFFESSADDIEHAILHRLSSADTILRRSCDASMLVQAVIDTIIDLAIPVSTAYLDVIGDLELDVLTEPSIKHTTSLYVVTSEITMLRNSVSPITSLIVALRDHKSVGMATNFPSGGRADHRNPQAGVKITPQALTYLGDVEDHIILIVESLDQMRRSCDNMIDLIFNTISAYQNESMKQLTVVTIIFLPLTFLTGYFGMNIEPFPALLHGEMYFWQIALPVVFAVTVFLMRDILSWWFSKVLLRRGISRSRKGRLSREAAILKRNL